MPYCDGMDWRVLLWSLHVCPILQACTGIRARVEEWSPCEAKVDGLTPVRNTCRRVLKPDIYTPKTLSFVYNYKRP